MKFLTRLSLLTLLCISIASLSACSKTHEQTEVGVDPTPQAVAGNEHTAQYADKPAVIEHGAPNQQVDPYTNSHVQENYAGEHGIATEQTAGEKLDIAKQNMKEAGHNVKEASVRLKNKVKEEFEHH